MTNVMRSFRIACALAAFGCASSYAYTECMDAGSTVQIGDCFNGEQAKAEKALNATYQRLIPLAKNNYDPKLAEDLRRAQRAWVEFRKLNCQFDDRKDRALHGLEKADCMLRMTREREIELRAAVDELARR